jgi:DNA-binding NarL/FixJ family response regulator
MAMRKSPEQTARSFPNALPRPGRWLRPADEMVERLFRGLDERDRRIVELSLQGFKVPEISAQVGIAERTVYRQLERVKGRLERLGDCDEAP